MPRGAATSADCLEVPQPAAYWLLRAFGVVMLLLSVWMILWLSDGGLDSGEVANVVFFGLTAQVALGYREGITIDRGAGEVRKWWGFIVPLAVRCHPIGAFDVVTVAFGKSATRLSWHGLYVSPEVALSGPQRRLFLGRYLLTASAREVGRQVASFMGLPLDDLLSGGDAG